MDTLKEGRIREVINVLKRQPMKLKDLIDELKIPKDSLLRILGHLKTWDLVDKDEKNYWYWRDYVFFDSPVKYQRALQHSQKLVLGLQLILGPLIPKTYDVLDADEFSRQKRAIQLQRHAEQHLAAYPKIFDELRQFRKLRLKLDLQKRGKLGELLERAKTVQGTILELRKKEGKLLKDISDEKLEDFAQTKEAMYEAYRKLAGDIQTLILQVEEGLTPLKGVCKLCRVKIKYLPQTTTTMTEKPKR